MESSHANYHAHMVTHDNEYVEWEEEWAVYQTNRPKRWFIVNMMVVVATFTKWVNIQCVVGVG